MNRLRKVLLLGGFWLATSVHAAPVAYVDLANAYEQSTALHGLIAQLDARMQSIRTAFEAKRAPLLAEIEALKTTKMHVDAQRARKRELLLALAELEQQAAREQQAVGKANEQATAKVDAQIAEVENELKLEYGLLAVFRTQDLLYQRPDSGLDLSAELYRRLNARLPSIELPVPAAPAPKL